MDQLFVYASLSNHDFRWKSCVFHHNLQTARQFTKNSWKLGGICCEMRGTLFHDISCTSARKIHWLMNGFRIKQLVEIGHLMWANPLDSSPDAKNGYPAGTSWNIHLPGARLKVGLPVEPRTYEIVGSEKKKLKLGFRFARYMKIILSSFILTASQHPPRLWVLPRWCKAKLLYNSNNCWV